jgi:hypothetical protein
MLNSAKYEADSLMAKISEYWKDDVSDIKIIMAKDSPVRMFDLAMRFYGKHDVIMEYERSTLGISIKINEKLIALGQLTDEEIFRGLKSYTSENLFHNFNVLDRTLKRMCAKELRISGVG